MRVDDVMSEDPVFVEANASTGDAIRKLIDHRIHHLPVLREGVLIGIVSDGDLRGGGFDVDRPVKSVVSSSVVSTTADADLADVVDAMVAHHISAVPVVDPGSRRLVGIVSYVDVLRAMRDLVWG